MAGERIRPRREDVRAGILIAAAQSFSRDGYDRASLAEITRAAGFTKGALYSNFASKQELFTALIEDLFDDVVRAAVIAQPSPAADWESVIRSAAIHTARHIAEHPQHYGLILEFSLLAGRDPDISARYAQMRSRHRAELATRIAEQAREHAVEVDAAALSRAVLVAVTGLAAEYIADPIGTPVETMSALILAAYRGF